MIITTKIRIKNTSYYISKGFISDSYGFIEIEINNLAKYSKHKILAKCDFCDKEKEVEYFNYYKNIKNMNMFSCSHKCSVYKTKKTNLERYGSETPLQNKDILEKFKQTNLEKYGYESPLQNKDVKEKTKQTNLEKYGVENVFQNSIIKEKVKQTNLEKYGFSSPLQNKDILEKLKKTNLEKYGFETSLKNNDVKEKTKQTNLEKYGCEYSLQNKEIQQKNKQTILEKYGVDNISQNEEIREKIKQTNLKKFGFETPLQNKNILEKLKQTNLDKYGFINVFQNEDIKEKSKQTNFEKYGIEYYSKTNEFKEKSKETCLKKYGNEIYSKSEESKKNTIIGQHPNYIKYSDNNISLFNCDLNKDHEFKIHCDNFHNRLNLNIPLCTICYPIGDQKSIKEKILLEYIKSIYSGEIISGYRDGIEIDIYLPELKLGIEFNGLYWHSELFKDKDYHINKQIFFKEKGIDTKMIYEDDFDNKLEIIKSQISNWSGLTKTKIYARKTYIKEINTEEYRDFLNSNHIQGYVTSKLVYGLYHNDNLVSLMCFDKKEGRLNMVENEWNLNRFCNLLNHNVIGGASKLLNHFIKTNNPSRIISYADKDWSNGNLYNVLGFKLINESKPDYKYIIDGVRVHKQNFTKSKLSKMGHDISLTESQIMNNLGINKIYDCGKMKFEFKIK